MPIEDGKTRSETKRPDLAMKNMRQGGARRDLSVSRSTRTSGLARESCHGLRLTVIPSASTIDCQYLLGILLRQLISSKFDTFLGPVSWNRCSLLMILENLIRGFSPPSLPNCEMKDVS